MAPLRLRRALPLAASLTLLFAAGTAGAAAPAFSYDPGLGRSVERALVAASFEHERPRVKDVYVKCYRDARAFEAPLPVRFGIAPSEARLIIAYHAGGGELHLRAGTCENARRLVAGLVRWDTAAAFSVLMHEAMHRQGVANERAASCLGADAVRWAARAFGLGDRQAERARLLAFRYTASTTTAEYQLPRHACLQMIAGDGLSWWQTVRRPRLEQRFERAAPGG
jgi:hypothetical protein